MNFSIAAPPGAIDIVRDDPVRLAKRRLLRKYPADPKRKWSPGASPRRIVEEDISQNPEQWNVNPKLRQNIPDFDVIIKQSLDWREDSLYTIFVQPQANNRILGLLGIEIPVLRFVSLPFEAVPVFLGKIPRTLYGNISRSINSTEVLAYWDFTSASLRLRRVCLELDTTTTTFDKDKGALISIDNILRFRAYCQDENFNPASDVDSIEIKAMRMRRSKILLQSTINGQGANQRRATVNNGALVSFALLDAGRHTLRLKAKPPGANDLWLSAYPEGLKLTDAEMADLRQRIHAMPVPTQMRRF
jgi:hypothetical protein